MEARGRPPAPARPEDDGSDAPCPLCLGPLTADGSREFSCKVGHRFARHELHRVAANRSSIALWSAASALRAEVQVLRAMAASFGDTELLDRADRLTSIGADLQATTTRYEATTPPIP